MLKRAKDKVQTVVHKDHSIIIPPATLRERTMTIGGSAGDGFDMSALERAEEAMAELEKDFSSWMKDEIDKLENARLYFKSEPADKDRQDALYRAAHDIRGQGKTFGYPLAGDLADGLCDLIEGADEIDATTVELADAHIDAIRAVVRDDVRDSGDAVARRLVAELRTAREGIIGVNRFVKIAVEG